MPRNYMTLDEYLTEQLQDPEFRAEWKKLEPEPSGVKSMSKPARHTYDPYSTHQPVLYEALLRTTGPVIEFGCGYGSTPLLHRYCETRQRKLVTLDTDRGWLDLFVDYVTDWHSFIHVSDWGAALGDDLLGGDMYSVAFIDQSPWAARATTIQAVKDIAHFIVLHDCDYFPDNGLFGVTLAGLNGTDERGERTYDDVFKYWREYFPPDPWPYPKTGPPTLLGSNFEACAWEIDFARYANEEDFYYLAP